MLTKYVVLFSTAPHEEEAAEIAHALVEKRLVACVNIVPKIRSVYTWQGKICDEPEVLMIMKAQERMTDKIMAELKKLHSYECPELISIPITNGLPDYLSWIDEQSINL
jgi:periplasmic divalent cation tolerance protein